MEEKVWSGGGLGGEAPGMWTLENISGTHNLQQLLHQSPFPWPGPTQQLEGFF